VPAQDLRKINGKTLLEVQELDELPEKAKAA
jgi:hypothetical protein